MPRLDSKILTSERCFWFTFVSFAREQVHKKSMIWGTPKFKDGKPYFLQSNEPKFDSGRFNPSSRVWWPGLGD
jgi:hypothetical protein